jgi:hypothetical protein
VPIKRFSPKGASLRLAQHPERSGGDQQREHHTVDWGEIRTQLRNKVSAQVLNCDYHQPDRAYHFNRMSEKRLHLRIPGSEFKVQGSKFKVMAGRAANFEPSTLNLERRVIRAGSAPQAP